MISTRTAASARVGPSKIALPRRRNARNGFNPESFLATAGVGRTVMNVERKQVLFAQGQPADAIFYIQKGRVRLNVVSERGKEATIALLGEGEFIGESCIAAAQHIRQTTATATTECTILRIDRKEMVRVLR